MTRKSWIKFERLVAAIHLAETSGAVVIWNEIINGRQFDVTLRFKYGIHEYLTVIECKDYNKKVPVDNVEALVTKAKDINANKVIMVSSNGYQSGCLDVANRHGVRLLTLNEIVEIGQDNLLSEMIPMLNVYDVHLVKNCGELFELEEEGGKLHYLMNHIKLVFQTGVVSPQRLVSEWQLKNPSMITDDEVAVDLPFKGEIAALIPHEGEIRVNGIRFKCKFIRGFMAKGPTLDTHILEGIGTKYDLYDEKGELIISMPASRVKLGFDTKLSAGKYYTCPRLHTYYYCESIINNTVTWILLEAYQHGQMIQAKFTQNIKYLHDYIEVTDSVKLNKLRVLLEEYNRPRQ